MIDFTPEERNDIAEFMFSYDTDVLIKDDAHSLIDALHNHKKIENPEDLKQQVEDQDPNISMVLYHLTKEVVSEAQLESIMKEYYTGG